jgi:hypothetical protein
VWSMNVSPVLCALLLVCALLVGAPLTVDARAPASTEDGDSPAVMTNAGAHALVRKTEMQRRPCRHAAAPRCHSVAFIKARAGVPNGFARR